LNKNEASATCLLADFAEPIFWTLKMEAICSSVTSVENQRTARRHIAEDDTLHNHRCENLKSYKNEVHYTVLGSDKCNENMCYFRFSTYITPQKVRFKVFVKAEEQVIPLFHCGV
jgi:hypothetical protein